MIAKMIILGFNGENVNKNDEIYKNIKTGLTGVILFDKDPNDKEKIKNIRNPKQLKELTLKLQNISSQNLLIGVDQEGGVVQRLRLSNGFMNTPSALEISKKDKLVTKKTYKNLAKMLNENGINLNFAPVVDLAINKNNKVIFKLNRSYGRDFKKVVKYSSILIDEQNKQKIVSVLKHFPGHGSSNTDSHKGFVDISKTWNEKELEPFRQIIKNKKIPMIMTAHVFNKNLDKNYPATLSYKINTKLLRNELKFNGVIISDDLQMNAISKHYDLKQTVTLAINSGVDILLFANQSRKYLKLSTIIKTIYNQILDKKILLKNIIESNKRIDKLLGEYK